MKHECTDLIVNRSHCSIVANKRYRIQKLQSKKDNPEKCKAHKTRTQYELNTTIRNQTQIS